MGKIVQYGVWISPKLVSTKNTTLFEILFTISGMLCSKKFQEPLSLASYFWESNNIWLPGITLFLSFNSVFVFFKIYLATILSLLTPFLQNWLHRLQTNQYIMEEIAKWYASTTCYLLARILNMEWRSKTCFSVYLLMLKADLRHSFHTRAYWNFCQIDTFF